MGVASLDGLIARVPLLGRTVLAILVLCGALLALVESRARILRDGTEVRLRTAPVDPRDLFRGDYVVLGYEIGTIHPTALEGDKRFSRYETVYVRVGPGPDGFAFARGIYKARPTSVSPDEAILAGRVNWVGSCVTQADDDRDCPGGRNGLTIEYGIESYFVPQGSGRAIERTERARIEVVAAVSGSGEAAIKRLLIDGKLVHAEPPY
jgi:uncharacterized membrane-anchored protein